MCLLKLVYYRYSSDYLELKYIYTLQYVTSQVTTINISESFATTVILC